MTFHKCKFVPECPTCHYRDMEERSLRDGYWCRHCKRLIPIEQIKWRAQKNKVAGSGQIAGPTYRHQIARDLLEKYERDRAGK